MPFNINEMLSTINANGGLSKASKFIVRITPPTSLFANHDGDLVFFCDSATLPGLQYASNEVKMAGYGNTEKRPYAPSFQDVNVTFYNDSDGKVMRFLHLWQQSIYNFNDKTNPNATARGLVNNTFAYPGGTNGTDGYYGVVDIIHYSEDEKEILSYQLDEAYPINIGDIQVDWNMNDQILKIPVTFAYTYWSADTLDPGAVDEISESRANALSNLQTRIDSEVSNITELLNVTSPYQVQRYTNIFARRLF